MVAGFQYIVPLIDVVRCELSSIHIRQKIKKNLEWNLVKIS